MIKQLCEMFPSLNPISVRKEEADDVIRLIKMIIRSSPSQNSASNIRKKVYADEVSWY